jgi:uncharacterized protein YdhG (YjbR/CyaY superfamily)
MMEKDHYQNIDEYIALYPKDIQKRLSKIRRLIQRIAPQAKEKISYQLPAFYYHGNLVYFGAFKNHIGFYPAGSAIKKFAQRLKPYQHSKGAIQFPNDEEIPYELIADIVKFRLKENIKR